MRAARVGIEAVAVRPLVVRLPSIVATLEKEIRRPVVAHDEDDVALPVWRTLLVGHGSKSSEVNTARPIVGNLDCRRWFPFATAHSLVADGRLGLRLAIERPEGFHEARAASAVVAHPENLQHELRRRFSAHHHVNFLARLDRLP